jgi:DNA-binding Lrp family transcriptional regulator
MKPFDDEQMRKTESSILIELMKGCRRSDRELAKVLNVSQPTVSRLRRKLEKEGYIKEYAAIPDFSKLGYEIMGVTLIKTSEPSTRERSGGVRQAVVKVEQEGPRASLMAVNGEGFQKNRLFITLYEDYSAYNEAMQLTKQSPHIEVKSLESFLVSLKDKNSYRLLTMSAIANDLMTRLDETRARVSFSKSNVVVCR